MSLDSDMVIDRVAEKSELLRKLKTLIIMYQIRLHSTLLSLHKVQSKEKVSKHLT